MDILEFFAVAKPYSIALHAAAAIVGMGTALASDIMFSFYSRDRVFDLKEQKVLENLSRIIWISLTVIIVSGIAIFLSDPSTYSASSKFLVKMTIVGILTANGYALSRWIQPHMARGNFLTSSKERSARMIAFMCGALSLISWCSAFGLGMLDTITLSYGALISIYAGILLIGIGAALTIERLKFN